MHITTLSRGTFVLSALPLFIAGAVSAATVPTAQNKISKEETLVVTANRSESSLWESPATI